MLQKGSLKNHVIPNVPRFAKGLSIGIPLTTFLEGRVVIDWGSTLFPLNETAGHATVEQALYMPRALQGSPGHRVKVAGFRRIVKVQN